MTLESKIINGISECIVSLQQIKSQLITNPNLQTKLQKLQIVTQKIDMQILMFENTICKVRSKVMSEHCLKKLKNYIFQSYHKITNQVNRLLTINKFETIQSQNGNRLEKIKQYEVQLESDWNEYDEKYKEIKQVNLKQKNNLRDAKQFKKIARQELNKQFLRIRMIAYRLYQQYSFHQHNQIKENLSLIKQQQSKIYKQLQQAKIQAESLRSSKKSLQRQLKELKKLNLIIGNRYFVSNSINIH